MQPSFSPRDEMVDTMINLAHLSKSHRIVVAGADSIELYLALRRRGFAFGALASACRRPSGQHSAGLITGDRCYQAIEASINQISKRLYAAASITISIESQQSGLGGKVRAKLQQLGFRIEAGAVVIRALCWRHIARSSASNLAPSRTLHSHAQDKFEG